VGDCWNFSGLSPLTNSDYLHSSKLCNGGKIKYHTRARHASRGGAGRRAQARGTCMNGPPKSGPRLAGTRLPFAVLIFGDLVPKSARYGNLNPKSNRFRSRSRREVGLTSLYI
jgi:hypothetical protein